MTTEEFIDGISSLVSEGTREKLYQSIRERPNGVFVEVGTYMGGTLFRMAHFAKKNNIPMKFYAVDTFTYENISFQQKEIDSLAHNAAPVSYYEIYQHNLSESNLSRDVITLKMDSMDAVDKFDDESIDVLFLDGCHGYPYTKNEILAWLPKVRIGGIILGHDFKDCGDVQRAAREALGEIQTTPENESYYWVKS